MRATTLPAMALAALPLLAGTAEAGTARMLEHHDPRAGETYESVEYLAAPGEANDVTVESGERAVTLRDSVGITPGSGCAHADPGDRTLVVCSYSRAEVGTGVLRVVLRDGDDRATITAGSAPLEGGPGNDVLRAGELGASLTGGPGDDELVGGVGRDFFYEERSASGSDVYRGGGEVDVVDYGLRAGAVRVDLSGDRDDGARGEGDTIGSDVEVLRGGRGNDRLTGGGGDNQLSGGRGSDVIFGGGGGDQLEGEANATGARPTRDRDRLYGGDGDDYLYGGDGTNLLAGGTGQDELWGGANPDAIRARDGAPDAVRCFGGRDRVSLDRQDFAASEPDRGRCERIRRRGAAAAVLASVGSQFVNTVHEPAGRSIDLYLGCPGDGPRRCSGRLALLLDERPLFERRFRVRRGRERRLVVPVPADLREEVRREGRVALTAVVSSRDRQGRPALRRRPLVLSSDPQ